MTWQRSECHPGIVTPRRRLATLSVAAVCVIVLGTMTAQAVAKQTSRDPVAFQHSIATYVGGWSDSTDPTGPQRDQAWVATHPAQLLAAGERACTWLAGKPDAPAVDPTGNTTEDNLMKAYIGVDFGGDLAYNAPGADIGVTLSPQGRITVVGAAWQYLCRSTRETKTAPQSLEED